MNIYVYLMRKESLGIHTTYINIISERNNVTNQNSNPERVLVLEEESSRTYISGSQNITECTNLESFRKNKIID